MARSLNKAELIGNLTRDPELRYTPAGAAVCTFGLATNRQWTTDSGEKKEEAEFHRIVAWNKLAELCAQLLTKGRKAYVEGRLQTRRWTAQDGVDRTTTEIVISDMIILDSRMVSAETQDFDVPEEVGEEVSQEAKKPVKVEKENISKPVKNVTNGKDKNTDSKKSKKAKEVNEESSDDDIPF